MDTKTSDSTRPRTGVSPIRLMLFFAAVLGTAWFAVGTAGAGAQDADPARAVVSWHCGGFEGHTGYITVTAVNNGTNGINDSYLRIEINDDDTGEQILEAAVINTRLKPDEVFSHTFSDIHDHNELKVRVYNNGEELETVHEFDLRCDASSAEAHTGCSSEGVGWIDYAASPRDDAPLLITLDGQGIVSPPQGVPENPGWSARVTDLPSGTYDFLATAGDEIIRNAKVVVDCDFNVGYTIGCEDGDSVLTFGMQTLSQQRNRFTLQQITTDGRVLPTEFDLSESITTSNGEDGQVTFRGFEDDAAAVNVLINREGYEHQWAEDFGLGCRVDEIGQYDWDIVDCTDDQRAAFEVSLEIDDVPGAVTVTVISSVGPLHSRTQFGGSGETLTFLIDSLDVGSTIDVLIGRENGESIFLDDLAVACDDVEPGEIATILISCLARNGRIDIFVENTGFSSAEYSAKVGHLAPRLRVVEPGATGKFTVTGRKDGPIEVILAKDAVIFDTATVIVACD